MRVHLFCSTSSPGFCAFVLRKIAVDNASNFKAGVSETLMKNFYVDDLLKSVESEDSAIQLIQYVRKICQRGGFILSLLPTEKVFLNQFQKNLERMVSRTEILMESYQKKGR